MMTKRTTWTGAPAMLAQPSEVASVAPRAAQNVASGKTDDAAYFAERAIRETA